jgi:competence protein ComEA
MGRLTAYEKIALGLSAAFVVICAVIFCMGQSDRGYTVTVSNRTPESVFQTEDVLVDETPDSLIPGEKINVNTAPLLELERLPGVGETRARAIVDWRGEHGPFRTAEDLLAVDGIGEGTLEKMRPYIEFG